MKFLSALFLFVAMTAMAQFPPPFIRNPFDTNDAVTVTNIVKSISGSGSTTNISGTNVDYAPGLNVTFTTNGHQVVISSGTSGVASNVFYDIAGTNTEIHQNGLTNVISAVVSHTEVQNATNGVKGWLGTAAYSNSTAFLGLAATNSFVETNDSRNMSWSGTNSFLGSNYFAGGVTFNTNVYYPKASILGNGGATFANGSVIVDAAGNITATSFSGNGASLTSLNASSLSSGTVPAAQMPAFTGDITTSAGSTATTLKNTGSAGQYTKVTFDAQGRETSGTTLGTGDIPDLSATYLLLAATNALVRSNDARALKLSGSNTLTGTLDLESELRVAGSAGSAGQVFTSAGAGATPTWSPAGAGSQTPILSDINYAGFSSTNMKNLTATGTVTAASFVGNGSGGGSLSLSNSAGTSLVEQHGPGDYSLWTNTATTLTATITNGGAIFGSNVAAANFYGGGANLTALNASALTSGTVPAAQAGELSNHLHMAGTALSAGDVYAWSGTQFTNGPPPSAVGGTDNGAWHTNGNSNPLGGTFWIGTQNSNEFNIYRNNHRVWTAFAGTTNSGVTGGGDRRTLGDGENVQAGYSNNVITYDSEGSVIAGGGGTSNGSNYINGLYAVISGGYSNVIDNAIGTTIAGGYENVIRTGNGQYLTISGGRKNLIRGGQGAVISGGHSNTVDGSDYAFIAGGRENAVISSSHYGFAAGRRSRVTHAGAFVLSDSQDTDRTDNGSDTFTANFQSGIVLNGTVNVNTNGAMPLSAPVFNVAVSGNLSSFSIGSTGAMIQSNTATFNDTGNHYVVISNGTLTASGNVTGAVLTATSQINGNGAGVTNVPIVTSVAIPMGAFFTSNVADGLTLTAATPSNPTNTGDAYVFADSVTNTVNIRFALPWDWNGSTVRVGLRSFCTGTNAAQGSAPPTNVVWSVRAAAIGNGDLDNNVTWGTAVVVTNGVGTNAFKGSESITANLTVGNSASSAKSILWQISRLGAATGDTETNNSLVLSEVRVYYQRNTRTDFPTASP